MCGYTSYQDPRLIPPDVNDVDEPEGDERLCDKCVHGEACRRQAVLWCEALGYNDSEWLADPEETLCCVVCELYKEA